MADEHRFAEWVAPIAATLATDRAEVIDLARSVPSDAWARSTADAGWTCKDVLAHLAGGNDQVVQNILRAVVNRTAIDARALDPDTDRENALRVAERRPWTVGQLIAELVRDGDEVQKLLALLTDADRDLLQGDSNLTLGAFLKIVHHERHDHIHLQQLRDALPP